MRIVTLGTEDWEALYIEGEKKSEGHSLDLEFVIEQIIKGFDESFAQTGDPSLRYEHFYFEPETEEEREEWDMGIYYEPKLKDVDPHLRQGISV